MLKYPTLILLTILISALSVGSVMANITFEKSRLLLLSIDAGDNMIDRHSAAHKTLVRSIRSGLQKSGHRVFEEDRDQSQPRNHRQNPRSAIKLAKEAGLRNLDALLLIAARFKEKHRGHSVTFAIDFWVQIIDPLSWKSVENIHWTSAPLTYDKYICLQRCQNEKRHRQIKKSASKLEKLLARKLDGTRKTQDAPAAGITWQPTPGPQAINPAGMVTLTLQGFTINEAHYLEERLVSYSGASDISLRRNAGHSRQYWYETDIPIWKFEKKLSGSLSDMGLQARMIERDGEITVIRQQREIAYYANE